MHAFFSVGDRSRTHECHKHAADKVNEFPFEELPFRERFGGELRNSGTL